MVKTSTKTYGNTKKVDHVEAFAFRLRFQNEVILIFRNLGRRTASSWSRLDPHLTGGGGGNDLSLSSAPVNRECAYREFILYASFDTANQILVPFNYTLI